MLNDANVKEHTCLQRCLDPAHNTVLNIEIDIN